MNANGHEFGRIGERGEYEKIGRLEKGRGVLGIWCLAWFWGGEVIL